MSTKRNPIGTKRKRRLLALIAALFALASCDDSNVKRGDKNYPETNPAPSRFIFFHGTIDPSLKVKFYIRWIADDPKCQYTISSIEGVYAQYHVTEDFPVELNGSSFSTRIPIDGVLPGSCRWRFLGLSYSGETGFGTSLIATNSLPLRPGQSPNGVIHLHCRKFMRAEKIQRFSRDEKIEVSLDCGDLSDSRETAALRGILWWHPEATDLEVHFDTKPLK